MHYTVDGPLAATSFTFVSVEAIFITGGIEQEVEVDDPMAVFQLDVGDETFELVFVDDLDRELFTQYTVKVDGGWDPEQAACLIKIVVADDNDQGPVFSGTPYLASILEGTDDIVPLVQVHLATPPLQCPL